MLVYLKYKQKGKVLKLHTVWCRGFMTQPARIYIAITQNSGGSTTSSVLRLTTGLDGQGLKLRRGRDFPYPSKQALRPTHPPVQCVPASFPWVKGARRRTDRPLLALRLSVKLYHYQTSVLALHVIRRTIHFPHIEGTETEIL